MSSDIRAALERLVGLQDDTRPTSAIASDWTDAIAAARAALAAEPVGDDDSLIDRWIESRPDWPNDWPAVTQSQLTALIGEALEHWGRPATQPAPEPGEVAAALKVIDKMQQEWVLLGNDDDGTASPSLSMPISLRRFAVLRDAISRAAALLQQQAAPAPEVGEVVEWLENHAAHLRKMQEIGALPETELQEMLDRAAALLQQLSAPAPVVAPVAVSDALIKAECALSDIAEGEPTLEAPDSYEWTEQRCAETLAMIRPVMKLHKIRTSEWPPQPLPQAGEGES